MFDKNVIRIWRKEEQDNGKQGWTFQGEFSNGNVHNWRPIFSGTYKVAMFDSLGRKTETIKTIQLRRG
jgi:hypothetical protein